MFFEEFLKKNRNKILGYLMLSEMLNNPEAMETPLPQAFLSDERLETLKRWLEDCMPLHNMIADLRDWDIHLAEGLGDEWYFEAVFGAESSIESWAEDLSDFFIRICDEYNLDYNQGSDHEEFENIVFEEALLFLKEWRYNVFKRAEKALYISNILKKLDNTDLFELEDAFKDTIKKISKEDEDEDDSHNLFRTGEVNTSESLESEIMQKTIFELKEITETALSGDDSSLANAWEEICVQIQYEESVCWDVYDQTVRGIVAGHVEELSEEDKIELWAETDNGGEWFYDQGGETAQGPPICEDDIVDYIIKEYLYKEAGDWSNKRIRAFLDQQYLKNK